MRPVYLLPVLLLTLACSSKLDRSTAEDLIRKSYPVVVPLLVPSQTSAPQGTPEHLRMLALKENLGQTGWFVISSQVAGGRETCTFHLKPDAPRFIKAAPTGFRLPAAEAVFVRASHLETTREGARVTYEIRLEKPTAQFPLFQAIHEGVKVGDVKLRHATFERRKGSWELTGTDEAFHKAE